MVCCCCCKSENVETTDKKIPPLKPPSRGCTDLPCLLVLVTVWCGLIFVCAFAFSFSFWPTLAGGYDSFGNTCGTKNSAIEGASMSGKNMTDRPFLFLQDAEHPERALALCVKQCPPRQIPSIAEVNRFFAETGSQLCRYDFAGHAYDFSALKASSEPGQPVLPECPALPVPASSPVQGRCIPDSNEGISIDRIREIIAQLNDLPLLQQVVADLYRCWKQVAALIGMSLLLSLLLLALLQLLTTVIGVLLTLTASVALLTVTCVLWWTYASLKLELDVTPPERILRTAALNETVLLTTAIIVTIATPFLIWAIVCCWRNLKTVADIFGEAARCIYSLPCLLLQPVWTALAEAVLLIATGVTLVALGSISHTEPTRDVVPGQPQRLLQNIPEVWPSYTWWVVPAVAIWTAEFFLACQWLVTAGAVCRWYFSRESHGGSGSTPSCPIARSFCTLACHHLGTAAFGSFLVTLLRLPRAALNWLQRNPTGDTENSWCGGSVCCSCPCQTACSCCLRCCENCVRVISRNAYAVTAIDGRSFCAAGRAALSALVTNAGAAAAVFGAGQLALFCGRILVTSVVSGAGILWFRRDAELHMYASPLLLTALGAYLASGCVFGVLEAVSETLLLCYCQDVATAAEEDTGDAVDGGVGEDEGSRLHASPRLAKMMQGLGAASVAQRRQKQPLQVEPEPPEQLQTSSFIETDL